MNNFKNVWLPETKRGLKSCYNDFVIKNMPEMVLNM